MRVFVCVCAKGGVSMEAYARNLGPSLFHAPVSVSCACVCLCVCVSAKGGVKYGSIREEFRPLALPCASERLELPGRILYVNNLHCT